jgi:uncharacterized protein (DUF1501 family)
MLAIPGFESKDTCDGVTRRDLMRIGGSAAFGVSLATLLGAQGQVRANEGKAEGGGKGFGKAKSVILIYLQGGPSHLDLFDPKDDVPAANKSIFKPINTKVEGLQFTELLPNLANVMDKATLIRTMSYTPNGLFNHTAAIYQMHTGYTTDKVSASGQLEPPNAKDFPTVGSNVVKFKPPTVPMLPFVMMPRPLQESNVIGKGGTAGFLGKAYDPYTLYPAGDDMDLAKMDKIKVDDLLLRDELSTARMERRASLRETVAKGMTDIDQAVSKYDLDSYYGKALGLVTSGRAKEAFDLKKEDDKLREKYGKNTFGQCLLLARRLIEAGTRFVEVNWPKVANSDNHSWDVHVGLSKRMKDQAAPMLDKGLSALITDLSERGMLEDTLVICVGEFGRSPRRGVSTSGNQNSDDGRDHWPYCYSAVLAGGGVKKGYVHGKSDKTGSAPLEGAVHPTELLATLYHAVGIKPDTIVYNHLNQPRELVKGEAVTALLG